MIRKISLLIFLGVFCFSFAQPAIAAIQRTSQDNAFLDALQIILNKIPDNQKLSLSDAQFITSTLDRHKLTSDVAQRFSVLLLEAKNAYNTKIGGDERNSFLLANTNDQFLTKINKAELNASVLLP